MPIILSIFLSINISSFHHNQSEAGIVPDPVGVHCQTIRHYAANHICHDELPNSRYVPVDLLHSGYLVEEEDIDHSGNLSSEEVVHMGLEADIDCFEEEDIVGFVVVDIVVGCCMNLGYPDSFRVVKDLLDRRHIEKEEEHYGWSSCRGLECYRMVGLNYNLADREVVLHHDWVAVVDCSLVVPELDLSMSYAIVGFLDWFVGMVDCTMSQKSHLVDKKLVVQHPSILLDHYCLENIQSCFQIAVAGRAGLMLVSFLSCAFVSQRKTYVTTKQTS